MFTIFLHRFNTTWAQGGVTCCITAKMAPVKYKRELTKTVDYLISRQIIVTKMYARYAFHRPKSCIFVSFQL